MNNILFIDASAFFYRIAYYCDRYATFTPNLIKANFQFLNEARFMLLDGQDRNKVIWCLDDEQRDYWRKSYAPGYKAQRRSKVNDSTYNLVKECFQNQIKDWAQLSYPSFEADDMAALGVGLFATAPFDYHCYLVTPDSDWQGLIGDRVSVITPTFQPYIRTKKEAYEWLCKAWAKQSKTHRRLWALPDWATFKPSDIWVWKAYVGDRSDNLPSSTDIRLIDLVHPLECVPEPYKTIAYAQIAKAQFYATDTALTLDYMSNLLNPPMTIIKRS